MLESVHKIPRIGIVLLPWFTGLLRLAAVGIVGICANLLPPLVMMKRVLIVAPKPQGLSRCHKYSQFRLAPMPCNLPSRKLSALAVSR